MREDDRIRIQHMIEAADDIRRFSAGRQRADLENDRMLLFALVRAIEIIGEAATKVSTETRECSPGVPWKALVGMRNRVIHAYFDVDRDIVWNAVTDEVPELRSMLQEFLDDPTGD